MVPLIITLLQWEFVVTTVVIFFTASIQPFNCHYSIFATLAKQLFLKISSTIFIKIF